MALTNFTGLTLPQNKAWSLDVWKVARQQSFLMSLAGTGPGAMIQRVTELKKTRKGTQAVVTLVPDLVGDGAMGDTVLWDNEEAILGAEQTIQIDQIRHANRLAGRMADQKTVVDFRSTSKDVLGFWLADRLDQMAFLTASGLDWRMKTNGGVRTGFAGTGVGTFTRTAAAGLALFDHASAADITAPSAKRSFRWDKTAGNLVAGSGTTTVVATDFPTYGMLVNLKAYAKDRRIRSLKAGAGLEVYHVFMHPQAIARLKLDADFLANIRGAGVRGNDNPLFSGAIVTVDGLVIHEYVHVFNTLGATTGTGTNAGWAGYKWGSTAAVNGSRTLLMGAQALAFADLGAPSWEEQSWDYGNQNGISTGKILGFKKPVFPSAIDGTNEDFGLITVDHAI
jgi:N4-gp56 family major capsid protein